MRNTLTILLALTLLSCYSTLLADDSQPGLLQTVAADGVVYLNWSPPKTGTDGYWIYRALPDAAFRRLNLRPVKGGFYKDTDVVNGQDYWYQITAIDREGSESAPSRRVLASPSPQAKPLAGY